MRTIDEIRNEVVGILLAHHEQEKAAGRAFYFAVEEVGKSDFYALPYFLQDDIKSPMPFLNVFIYGYWSNSHITYLVITEDGRAFLIGQITNRYDDDPITISYKLFEYFSKQLDSLRFVHGQHAAGTFLYIKEIVDDSSLAKKLNSFLQKIKPEIDKIIEPLRQNTKYSYYFFSRQQFDDYLAQEPFYNRPAVVDKKKLALKSVRVQNFKGIRQLFLDELSASARWIILTGKNGYGKTSVLQAIAAGLYGSPDESGTELVPGNAFVGVEYYASGNVVETNSRTPALEAAPKTLRSELATYGSSRLQVTAMVSSETIEQQAPTTYHLFNSDGLLLNVEQYLKDTYSFDRPSFDQLVKLFTELLPNLARIDVVPNNKIPEVRYYEQDESGKPLTDGLLYSQLASGLKNIIAMIGDLVYRLSVRQNVDKLSELEGIVLIDELELHLHPDLQKSLPKILSEQFPNIQFIASTHSPIPLLGVPSNTVLLHVTRTEEKGIEVEKLEVDFSILTPNAILSSPIFGFQELIPESKPDAKMIRSENRYQAIVDNQQTTAQIDSFLSEEKQAELLRLLKKD